MIPTAPQSLVRRIRVPGYLILGIAMILPLMDLITSVMPLRPTTVVWRFGAVGLFSSAVGAPLLLLFFVYALAYFSGDRKIMIAAGALSGLIALIILLSSGAFALDALQMKQRVQPAAVSKFMMASGQAMLKLALQGTAALVLAVSAFRTIRGAKAVVPATKAETRASSSLLMGRGGSRAAGEVVESRVSAEE